MENCTLSNVKLYYSFLLASSLCCTFCAQLTSRDVCIQVFGTPVARVYDSTKKRQQYFDILKAFFVRLSSEYKTLDSDRKVNRNMYPDAVTRDRMRLIDPKSGQLEPIHHCLVEEL